MPALIQLLFSFKGRIDRRQFWQANAWLGLLLVGTALGFGLWLMVYDATDVHNPISQLMVFEAFMNCLTLLLVCVNLWCILAIAWKRLHDRNRHGAWSVALVLIPPVGVIWWVIELGTWKGTDGPNRYGPSPSRS